MTHPVDEYSDDQLHDLMMRVDAKGFPGDLEQLWAVEQSRYRETLRRIPPARGDQATVLDLGSSRPWLPFISVLLGYRRITLNTSYPESGFVADGLEVRGAPRSDVRVSVFDIERNAFPHPDESFDLVLCLQVLEHLAVDPMAMMSEVNRVLKPGGTFLLTTPNVVRYSNVVRLMLGENPYGWAAYNGYDGNRHNREYAPAEIHRLLCAGGITPDEVVTFGAKRRGFQRDALKHLAGVAFAPFRKCPRKWRQDLILAVGRKTSVQIERRPDWLYFDLAERKHAEATRNKALATAG